MTSGWQKRGERKRGIGKEFANSGDTFLSMIQLTTRRRVHARSLAKVALSAPCEPGRLVRRDGDAVELKPGGQARSGRDLTHQSGSDCERVEGIHSAERRRQQRASRRPMRSRRAMVFSVHGQMAIRSDNTVESIS